MISVCVAVYCEHGPPNVASLARELPDALGGREGELLVALNGVPPSAAPADARTVDLGVNRGVAPAWNAAASAARGEVLVFANDDVRLGPGALQRLGDVLESEPAAGVAGPLGSRWSLQRGEHLGWVSPPQDGGAPAAECDVVSGFLFACTRETWRRVGGFDEFYAPASFEEVDFCTAARAAGLRCLVVPGVRWEHEWGVSRRQMPWARARWDGRSETWRSIHRRNRRHFREKWASRDATPSAP